MLAKAYEAQCEASELVASSRAGENRTAALATLMLGSICAGKR